MLLVPHSASKLVAGFDLPFFPEPEISVAMRNLTAFGGFSGAEREMIRSGNAKRLFPRLGGTNPRQGA